MTPAKVALLAAFLILVIVGAQVYLGRISAMPSSNAGVVYVTDHLTGKVYLCTAQGCSQYYPPPTVFVGTSK
jgi:hypothetical protein